MRSGEKMRSSARVFSPFFLSTVNGAIARLKLLGLEVCPPRPSSTAETRFLKGGSISLMARMSVEMGIGSCSSSRNSPYASLYAVDMVFPWSSQSEDQ